MCQESLSPGLLELDSWAISSLTSHVLDFFDDSLQTNVTEAEEIRFE